MFSYKLREQRNSRTFPHATFAHGIPHAERYGTMGVDETEELTGCILLLEERGGEEEKSHPLFLNDSRHHYSSYLTQPRPTTPPSTRPPTQPSFSNYPPASSHETSAIANTAFTGGEKEGTEVGNGNYRDLFTHSCFFFFTASITASTLLLF